MESFLKSPLEKTENLKDFYKIDCYFYKVTLHIMIF